MTALRMQAFDPCAPLPAGVMALEASAGTGKTYTVAALAARYVAEGTELQKMLLVSFTRSAAGELRERVRERLADAERDLSRTLAGGKAIAVDEVTSLLCSGSSDELRIRQRRLLAAVTDFDAATISTTHSFCQDMLSELGILADYERDVKFTETLDDVREEVVDDLYVRAFYGRTGMAKLTRAELSQIGELAARYPEAPVVPAHPEPGSAAERRVRAARSIRKEFDDRKRRAGLVGYDDLVTRLLRTVTGPNGELAVRRLRERYRVVLIDEFQDTDPVQWEILESAFNAPGITLALIGDPKQAIYAFRGADVYAYLAARRVAASKPLLTVNWRSDGDLIRAQNTFFGPARLGHPDITYTQMDAAPGHDGSRLHGRTGGALRLRILPRGDSGVQTTAGGYAQVGSARELAGCDVAQVVVELLRSGALCERRDGAGNVLERRPLGPGDIAVLSYKRRNAEIVQDELWAQNVPAVVGGAGSVFLTDAARDWLALLEALEQPAASSAARRVAIGRFIGMRAAELARADEALLESLHQSLHRWSRVLRADGVAALLNTIVRERQLPGQLLREVGSERYLTDVRHVGQLLHQAAKSDGLGLSALVGWYRNRVAEAEDGSSDEERSRRLESDDNSVQVMTIHRSKGLEFPIVLCPDLWDWPPPRDRFPPVAFHDPAADDLLKLDVGLEGREFNQHLAAAKAENQGEWLRLVYVALTRAMHQTVVWWTGSWYSGGSGLSRLLFDMQEDGTIPADGSKVPPDAHAEARMRELAGRSGGTITVEQGLSGSTDPWEGEAREVPRLSVAEFTRALDARWRRASYSSITAAAYEPHVGSEPEHPAVADEPEGDEPTGGVAVTGEVPAQLAIVSPMGALPMGTSFGTLIHRALEQVDFASGRLETDLRRTLQEFGSRLLDEDELSAAAVGLQAAIETPLGPSVGGASLRDVQPRDRLDELVFELPLAGGDRPTGEVTVSAIGDLLSAHLPADDPLAGYAERLRDPALTAVFRGYLTGSIDLLLRLSGASRPRFAVVDYKTNWLGREGEPLTLAHYTPPVLREEMLRAHYALQALLYSVAAYRFLRWRVAGYDQREDFAGVLYLFLRGMAGPETPRLDGHPCGVFSWTSPAELVESLSELLDAGVAA